MIKISVKQEFRDRENFNKVHPVGELLELENDRAISLKQRDIVEFVEEYKPKRGRKKKDIE